jgi:hypothetical protein
MNNTKVCRLMGQGRFKGIQDEKKEMKFDVVSMEI